jgi:hypothetical protein
MTSWHDVEVGKGFSGFGDIDPYIDWAFGEISSTGEDEISSPGKGERVSIGKRLPSGVFPILLRLKEHTISQFEDGKIFDPAHRPMNWREVVRVPPVYLEHGNGPGDGTYFTALVRPEFFEYFVPDIWGQSTPKALRSAIANMGVGRALLEGTFARGQVGTLELGAPELSAVAPGALSAPSGKTQAGTVVVGIIDDGLAFANARFRTAEGGTRVEHIWLQDGVADPGTARYGYGRSLSKTDIDKELCAPFGFVDEDEVYARLCATPDGGSRSLALSGSHGTHVMDIACGYEPGCAPRTEGMQGDHRPIVCVQLPMTTSDDTSGASLDTFVVDGVRYILDKADEIAHSRGCARLPVVINFSYGTAAGPHDGTSNLERAIGELIRARRGTSAPLEVVVPAGNSRLKRCHALVRFEGRCGEKGSTRSLSWRVLPDDRTTSHLEIWLPPTLQCLSESRVRLSVEPPFSEPCTPMEEHLDPRQFRVWGEKREKGMCYLRYCYVPAPTSRGMFLVTLTPTVHPDTMDVAAPAGEWKIILENTGLESEEEVHAWIQRDDTRYGQLPFGRQSYFDDPEYVTFDENGRVPELDSEASLVKRAETLNAIATEPATIVVGGFHRKDFLPAGYSGEGTAISRNGPDVAAVSVAAVSDESIIRRGVLATGTRSGSIVALTGTSVAAPQIARLVARLMAQGKPADRSAIRDLARAEEEEDTAGLRPRARAERIGAGRIHRSPVVSLPGLVEEG